MPLTKFLGVSSQKTNSIFTDIIQIEVEPPPSYPIFYTFIFDTMLIFDHVDCLFITNLRELDIPELYRPCVFQFFFKSIL